ncbi:MAG TPA: HK97 family phage prohead protease [Actinomycetes bacterium]|nr:HK97 family phage prohead protease [Actinomycetes bacterium]
MNEPETRAIAGGLELREEAGKRPRLKGYAAVFDSKSVDLGGFIEVVKPGAFKRALEKGQDVRALVNHNPDLIIGRSGKTGSLTMMEDDRGLLVEIEPPDTQAGRDVIENVKSGVLDGMSFAFRAVTEKWDTKGKPAFRELLDVDLFDVSVVAFPAYPKTRVAVRSLEEALAREAEASREAEAQNRERRLRLHEKTYRL